MDKEKNKYIVKWYNRYLWGTIFIFMADVILTVFFTVLCLLDKNFAMEIGIYFTIFVCMVLTLGGVACFFKCRKIKKDLKK